MLPCVCLYWLYFNADTHFFLIDLMYLVFEFSKTLKLGEVLAYYGTLDIIGLALKD